MHFIKIYLYLFFRPRSSFDFHKVPIISVWKVQQSPLRKGSRCFHIRYTSCKIRWKTPTSTTKCFWKSVNIICQRSWSVAEMKDQSACEWDGQPSLATSAMAFRSQKFSLSTLACMSVMMPLHHIYTTVLQDSQERLFRKSTHDLGSIRLHITWEQRVNILGMDENKCVQGKILTLILVMLGVIQLLDGYPRCC